MDNYAKELSLHYSRSEGVPTGDQQALFNVLGSPEHTHTRLGRGEDVVRGALADALQDSGRDTEAELLRDYKRPVSIQHVDGHPTIHPMTVKGLGEMGRQYLETMLWSSTHNEVDEDGNDLTQPRPLDETHSLSDIHPHTLGYLANHIHQFYRSLPDHLKEAVDTDPGQAGHDLWLTQAGHGANFLDRDYGESEDVNGYHSHAQELFDHAKKQADNVDDPYVGDDNLIHHIKAH